MPDLILEMDSEARTHVDIYHALGVRELWQFSQAGLSINKLLAGRYVTVEESIFFPDLPIKDLLPYCLEQSRTLGRNIVMRDFRRWIKDTQQRLNET